MKLPQKSFFGFLIETFFCKNFKFFLVLKIVITFLKRNKCEDIVQKTFEDEVKFARLRNRLVHAIIATVSLSPNWQVKHIMFIPV